MGVCGWGSGGWGRWGVCMYMWRQKLTSGSFSIALHHIFLRLHLALDIQLDWWASKPPRSACLCLARCWGYRHTSLCPDFCWVLMILIQPLELAQQAFPYGTREPPETYLFIGSHRHPGLSVTKF